MLVGLSFLIVFEVIADILAKEYSLRGSWIYAVAAISAYIVANSFWLFALRSGAGLARGSIIFGIAQAVLAVIIGVVYYKEAYSITTTVGMVFGLVSIILMSV